MQADTYLVVIVQVLRRWWRRLRPQELPPVGEVRLKNLGWRRRLDGGRDLGGGWRRLQHHVGYGVHGVTVLLPLPQFAADKTDSNHGAVTAHHFTVGVPVREIKDSYFEAVYVRFGNISTLNSPCGASTVTTHNVAINKSLWYLFCFENTSLVPLAGVTRSRA